MTLIEANARNAGPPRRMTPARLLIAAASLLLIAAAANPAVAATESSDPDWPCIQRLVPELTASQMWSGVPPTSAQGVANDHDPELAALARELASSTTPLEEAATAVDRFAEGLTPGERNVQMARLFSAVLGVINQERSEIIAGIKRYTRRQRRLADKIAQDSRQLADLQPGTTPDAETQALLDERQWDLRVFEDRRQILNQICEQPVLMEQRAFFLSRAMQDHLQPN